MKGRGQPSRLHVHVRGLVGLLMLALASTSSALADAGARAERASALDSGISGRVLVGPTCPVQTQPPTPSCADRPLATAIRVMRLANGTVAARTRSGSDGRFRVRLRPGRYEVRAASGRPVPRCGSLRVTLRSHRFAHVTLSCDSGIR